MESPGYRYRRSPSSDRFLGLFSFSPPDNPVSHGGELVEADVFWTNDQDQFGSNSNSTRFEQEPDRRHRLKIQKSGILAALPDPDRGSQVLCRKASISPSSARSIKRPPAQNQSSQERDYSQSAPIRQFNQSAPMNVPSMARAIEKRRNLEIFELGDDGDDQMLPPHEIVARGSGVSPNTTFSVLEGVGRTLKGRDQFKIIPLQVFNSIPFFNTSISFNLLHCFKQFSYNVKYKHYLQQ